ncbi:DUF1907-domain-containing protein [Aspergillus steynii IBT 23096]|uniref:DUF1907-domain-containing protein n=1 Tax=Aspergillus steynii IBT 23096 TaxID=1392250 RepID=A0A2I2GRI3_9EURO|nr:DUF1907-domain-containing protein [Aspergillus steynii IBT 23096]PLB55489.1 DUF1907-domain-containing protein [Aspergillus steynii IBT 23096]
MRTQKFTLSPPTLEELAEPLSAALRANYEHAAVSVIPCPDLRNPPLCLATEGICGDEKISDIGGQPNLFPRPQLTSRYSLPEIAQAMELHHHSGGLIGAGAGPFHIVGQNCELSPNLSWTAGLDSIDNRTHFAHIDRATGAVGVDKSPSLDCALMANLYGSRGEPGPVLKITARKRKQHGQERSFTECIRKGLRVAYGDSRTVSLGGVFVIRSGSARYHVMPDFPAEEQLPFKDFEHHNDWLTYHDFAAPMVCYSVLHSADPGRKLGLRLEHTHGYCPLGRQAGGHYHYEVEGDGEEIEYEGYFNVAKTIYRVDRPAVTLDRDLHD